MDNKDTAKIIGKLILAYPRFDTFKDNNQVKLTVVLWADAFRDEPYEVVDLAINKLIRESPFPPTIHDVVRTITGFITPEQLSPGESWGKVVKAIGKYGYSNWEEAEKSFDELTRATVINIGWREICLSENTEITRAHYLKMFEAMSKRTRETALLPEWMGEKINLLKSQYQEKQKLLKNAEE